MTKKTGKVYKVLFWGILLTALTIVFITVITKVDTSKIYEIIALGSELTLYSIDSNGEVKETKTFDLPQKDEIMKVELFKERNKNHFLLTGKLDESMSVWSIFDIEESGPIDFHSYFKGKVHSRNYERFIEFNFEKEELISVRGHTIKKKSDESTVLTSIQPEDIEREIDCNITGYKRIGEDKLLIQVVKGSNFVESAEGKNGVFYENSLILVSQKNQKIIRMISFGFSPINSTFFSSYNHFSTPLSISSDGTKAAFIVLFPPEENRESSQAVTDSLWLCVLDLRKFRAKKIVKIAPYSNPFSFAQPMPIAWLQNGKESLIALSYSSFTLPENIINSKTLIVDVDKGNILKEWEDGSSVLRWSRDGRFLGIIKGSYLNSSDYYYQEKNSYGSSGSLLLYNLTKDEEIKIFQSILLSNFYWVNIRTAR